VRPLDFQAPASVEETLRLLERHGQGATLLAGGQSLMILLRQGLVVPEVLVGLKRVAELGTIRATPEGLTLGSMVTYHAAAADPLVASGAPIVRAAASSVGSVHIRNLGTVGGSVCHADPAGDVPTVLLALDATLRTVRPDGTGRRHPLDGFYRGLFETLLEPDELLVSIDLPARAPGETFGYRRFSFRQGEYPTAVAACRLRFRDGRCADARVAVGGGDPYPRRLRELEALLAGATAGEVMEATVGAAPFESLRPMADVRGSERWKRRVVASLVRRAVADALGPGNGHG
jgi:aerobic carbon-monoxide dehydrogenase medium subunit